MSGGKIKQGTGKNRGYIGYHTTWDNKKVFLRSKAEFIYARVLDHEKIPYKMECVRYIVDDKTYKPDFFIFDSKYEKILKIVETKGLDAKKVATEYMNRYKAYFESIGIEYEVIWKYQSLVTKYNLHDDIQNWIFKSVSEYDFVPDTRGENNPMYGKTHTIETKNIIGDKCRERNIDPEYRKKNSEAQKAFFNSAKGMERRKELSAFRKLLVEQKRRELDLKDPMIEKKCIECGSIFIERTSSKCLCGGKCKRKWNFKNVPGYGQHKNK